MTQGYPMKWFDPPKTAFWFGQHVKVKWYEVECGESFATITGMNTDRHNNEVMYTVTEADGSVTDMIDEAMLERVYITDFPELN